ncbi:MAG TPA: pyridoxamine 5'-phosphate oxidase family protein [Syntrophorhabdaceae bacterium]|nr:pyridoxamine 5'-phosphate oxidase family protein [Syntrophorhabdaceae bacterium]
MSANLMEFFNKQPRLGVLSTANKAGEVNSAYFGSLRMVDEKTVVMALGNNRTFSHLQENPNACYLIMEPGKALPEWKGVRIYLKMTRCETSGDTVETMKKQLAEKAGAAAAKIVYAAVTFEVTSIRPLADFGQGWEKSI